MSKPKSLTDFINILDHDPETLAFLIDQAITDKALLRAGKLKPVLERKSLAAYFEKPSLRTRLSFDVAMTQLGGKATYLTLAEVGLGKREPVKDVARVVSGMCDGIVARTFSHESVVELARYASVPVINALTDYNHPCQAMADVMTVKEEFSTLNGLKVAFVGDGNNVARSLAAVCCKLGMVFSIATPKGYELDDAFLRELGDLTPAVEIIQTHDPIEAITDAEVVYTDTWVSMGQEDDRTERLNGFRGFQINTDLLKSARPQAIVLHCLPAYRGNEITDEVMECGQSRVFEEAENRLHFQRTLLSVLMTD